MGECYFESARSVDRVSSVEHEARLVGRALTAAKFQALLTACRQFILDAVDQRVLIAGVTVQRPHHGTADCAKRLTGFSQFVCHTVLVIIGNVNQVGTARIRSVSPWSQLVSGIIKRDIAFLDFGQSIYNRRAVDASGRI